MLEAAARTGLTLDTPCGGEGTCGKCRVQIVRGACEPTPADEAMFTGSELGDGWRLACQTNICGECVVHVPDSSLFASYHQILAEAQGGRADDVQPAVRKIYVELASPTLDDNTPDLDRLERKVGRLKVGLDLLVRLPQTLRECDFKGTAVLADHHLIDFEPGDTTDRCCGAAFDVGTTTLVGSLLNLRTGCESAIVSRMNPQVNLGDDVLSRIKHSAAPGGLAELNGLIARAMDEMLGELCAEASVDRRDVYEIAFSGNTTMEHLLCGIEVSQLGRIPFVPAHSRGLILPASDLGLNVHPLGSAYVFPVVGGFVGGDAVAGMLATRLGDQEGPVLMVDIGTNGEIVLGFDGQLWAASTAAGPAFEGARISCGMRATRGAIEKVLLDGDVHCSTIGDAPAVGVCGSGLIDAAAELLNNGLITREGRLLPPEELPAALPDPLRRRARRNGDGQVEFVLWQDDANTVALTERDIRELQLACGAIRAGIVILLKQAHLTSADLKRVLIAGGFGSFIRRNHAQRIGLLPPDIHHERINYVGNASLNGARWALVSAGARKHAEALAARTRHVELSQDPDFQTEFAEGMIFPEGK